MNFSPALPTMMSSLISHAPSPDPVAAYRFQHTAKAALNLATAAQGPKRDFEAECNFLGQISHGEGFRYSGSHEGIVCELSISIGEQRQAWLPLSRQALSITCSGDEFKFELTQASKSSGGRIVWNHGLDLHYATNNVTDWPRLTVKMYALNQNSQLIPIACGTASLPTEPGPFELRIPCWRPLAQDFWRDLMASWSGASPVPLPESSVIDSKASISRRTLVTVNSGTVVISGDVLLRKFSVHGVATRPSTC